MKFNLSKIEMNNSDIKRGIKLPESLTPKLAEFIGIMVGDGHLSWYPGLTTQGNKIVRCDIRISCNKNEQEYISYIRNLFYSLFNIKSNYEPDPRSETIIIRANSKVIVQYINKVCGIPLNRKTNVVSIPEIIKAADNNIKYAFLRGLADTDFSLTFQNRTNKGHNYPLIKGNFKSKYLVKDLEILFKDLEFKYSTYYDQIRYDKRFGPTTINSIHLYGRDNFSRWVNNIGFSNPKFQRKVEKWQKDGVCPPGY